MTQVLFITDGGPIQGMGHVFETLAVAENVNGDAEKIIFSVYEEKEKPRKLIHEAGYQLLPWNQVDSTHKSITADTIVVDLPNVNESILSMVDPDNLIVYGNMDTNLPSSTKKYANAIVSPLAMLHGFSGARIVEEGTLSFLGPSYLILRKEFDQYANSHKSGDLETILLTFGGADPSNLTTKVLKQMRDMAGVNLNIVLGPAFDHYDAFREAVSNYPSDRVTVYENTNNMASIIHNSDFVLTSPGLTFLESLYIGVPTLAFFQNDEQRITFNGVDHAYNFSNIDNLKDVVMQTYEMGRPEAFEKIGSSKSEVIKLIVND